MSHANHSRRFAISLLAVTLVSAALSFAAERPDRAALLAEAGAPEPIALHRPQNAIVLPDDLLLNDHPSLEIHLAQDSAAGPLTIRRASAGDGRLYLGLRSSNGDLIGSAKVTVDNHEFPASIAGGELWLSVKPRIGHL